jgi:hypothetical protein
MHVCADYAIVVSFGVREGIGMDYRDLSIVSQRCVLPLKVRVQKRDNGRSIMVLKYLLK